VRVRATIKLRNDAILSARERLGLTQRAVVDGAGVSIVVLRGLECLQYDADYYCQAIERLRTAPSWDRHEERGIKAILSGAEKVAGFLELELGEVLPSLGGVKIEDVTRVANVDPQQLAELCAGVGSHTLTLAQDPSCGAIVNERKDAIDQVLKTLPQRTAYVLRQRNGMGCTPKTYDEIGREIGVTRERVRQIELKGLSDMRLPQRRWKLEGNRG
jgi:RNA polymerase sigma factor (sigma-70 family)